MFYLSSTKKAAWLLAVSLLAGCGGGGGNGDDGSGGDTASAPEVEAVTAEPSSQLTSLSKTLAFEVTGTGDGVDWDGVEVSSPNHEVSAQTKPDQNRVVVAPADQWSEGEIELDLSVPAGASDAVEERAFVYLVESGRDLEVDMTARPPAGEAPLDVRFVPDVEATTVAEELRWDFDGDGDFETSGRVSQPQTYTYEQPGSFEAKLLARDNLGNERATTVTIDVGNAAPEVSASASPSTGEPELTVSFDVTASDDDGIDTYEWDFEGNGSFNETTQDSTNEFTYSDEGTFQPRIRVTDTLGASTTVSVPTVEVEVKEGAPQVEATASPNSGDAPLDVQLNGSADTPAGVTVNEWRWDTDGDGETEVTSQSDPSTSVTVSEPGTSFPTLTAVTEAGVTASDSVRVAVEPEFSLSRNTDTFQPRIGETVTINTELSGDTEVSLIAETPAGRRVATIVPWQTREAGSYTDTWDGTDDEGSIVSEGAYRFVLLYRVDGVEKRFDLAERTGGNTFNPNRSQLPSEFAPQGGDPLEVEFTLDEAARVTAFMGRLNVNVRFVTFMQRKALGRGTHTVVWHATRNDGTLIPNAPANDILFGIQARSFADNEVFLRSGVHVSNVESEPAILMPHEKPQHAGAVLTPLEPGADHAMASASIDFELNRGGDVRLTVRDADTGALVTQRRFEDLEAGENTIRWNGRNLGGDLVPAGTYRLGLAGIDERGARTAQRFTLQRVFY